MKRLLLLVVAVMLALPVLAQDKAADAKLQADLFAKEKMLWDAFFKKDAKMFDDMLAADGVFIDGMGVSGKPELLKMVGTMNCKMKSYSFSQQKMTRLDNDAVILSFKATQDGECDGQKVPATSFVTSTWVMRNGKWMGISHAEVPAMAMPAAPPKKK
jgi:hypothetical protein